MKKIILIVVPVLVLGGAFVALAVIGVIKVPGLTRKQPKPPVLYSQDKKKDEKPPAEPPKPVAKKAEPVKTPEGPKTDPVKGAKKLAQLWNSVPTPKLVELCKGFKDSELADVMVNMDPEKVAELLAMLDAKRSALLSKELRKVASVVPKPAS